MSDSGIQPGLKFSQVKNCISCGKGIAHAGHVHFYRVVVEQHVLDLPALRDRAGIELMLQSPRLADVFAPSAGLSKRMDQADMLFCADCGIEEIAPLLVIMGEQSEAATNQTAS